MIKSINIRHYSVLIGYIAQPKDESVAMDALNIKILDILQQNGRVKYTEMAKSLGVALSTVVERVKRLEEQGVIQGYRAVVPPEQLGFKVQALITVGLNRHHSETICQFEDAIGRITQIRACYHITGRYDYMLHVVAEDVEQLGELIKRQISRLPGFETSETFIMFSEIKRYEQWCTPYRADPDSCHS